MVFKQETRVCLDSDGILEQIEQTNPIPPFLVTIAAFPDSSLSVVHNWVRLLSNAAIWTKPWASNRSLDSAFSWLSLSKHCIAGCSLTPPSPGIHLTIPVYNLRVIVQTNSLRSGKVKKKGIEK